MRDDTATKASKGRIGDPVGRIANSSSPDQKWIVIPNEAAGRRKSEESLIQTKRNIKK
jgi:hypothetical protein